MLDCTSLFEFSQGIFLPAYFDSGIKKSAIPFAIQEQGAQPTLPAEIQDQILTQDEAIGASITPLSDTVTHVCTQYMGELLKKKCVDDGLLTHACPQLVGLFTGLLEDGQVPIESAAIINSSAQGTPQLEIVYDGGERLYLRYDPITDQITGRGTSLNANANFAPETIVRELNPAEANAYLQNVFRNNPSERRLLSNAFARSEATRRHMCNNNPTPPSLQPERVTIPIEVKDSMPVPVLQDSKEPNQQVLNVILIGSLVVGLMGFGLARRSRLANT